MNLIMKRLKNPVISYSNPGSKIKTIYAFDSLNHELLPIRDVDLDAQIQSYYDETNYKDLISRSLAPNDMREVILQKYPQNERILYGDSSLFTDNYMDNLKLLQELSKFDFTIVENTTTKESEATENE